MEVEIETMAKDSADLLERMARAAEGENRDPADLTMVYIVGGLFFLLYLVVSYILTSSENERKRLLEKAK